MKKIALFLLISLLLSISGSCTPAVAAEATAKGITYYDLFFEIDPSQGIFRSEQHVTLAAGMVSKQALTIYIGDDLVIDRLSLEDKAGNEIEINKWEKVDSYSVTYFGKQLIYSVISIQIAENIPTDTELTVNLEYHLPPDKIKEGLAESIYALFASSQGSHAGGPESGAFVMVDGNLSAPMTITIKHPNTFQCALPGEQVELAEIDGYVTLTYQATHPYDPSFSCAPYKVLSKEMGGMRIELFVPDHINLSPLMLDTAAQILSLYRDKFGEPPDPGLRIAFLELSAEGSGGESNGNLILLSNIESFIDYDKDEAVQDTFIHLIAHEGYHLWNTWGVTWEGSLEEWWVEGGANFMASWAKEILYGAESGSKNRLQHLQGFDEQESYRYKKNLANLGDDWFDHYTLVYDYGAIVWEQLRQKIGSEALANGLQDFYETHRDQPVNYDDFIASMQKYTDADVAATLKPWIQHNARIDLIIDKVTIQPVDDHFEVLVDMEVDSDRNYEIFTALGYKTSLDDDWQLLDLHLTKRGQHLIKFNCEKPVTEIQVDPEYRVPQIHPDDNAWVVEEPQ